MIDADLASPDDRRAFRRYRRLVALACCLAAVSGSRPALTSVQPEAPAPAPAGVVRFDIPPQPLFSALEAYAKVTGVTISYDSGLARNSWSAGVKGDFTAETALQILLQGTGLDPIYAKATGIVLAPHASAGAPPGARAAEAPQAEASHEPPTLNLGTIYVDAPAWAVQASHQRYARLVATGIQQALRTVAHARAQQYHVGLRVWLTPSGAVGRSEIAESTGDPDLDRKISAALAMLAIVEPPPRDMPQPVDVRVSAQGLAGHR